MALRRFLVLPVVFLSSLALAQEADHPLCTCKPRKVGESGSRRDWTGYRKHLVWHYSVEEAQRIARAENKMIFWYHVVGDLDKEGC